MRWLAGAAILLLGVAALATFFAFRSPAFWAGLVPIIVSALLPVILKRQTSVKEAAWRERQKQGLPPQSQGQRHPGEH